MCAQFMCRSAGIPSSAGPLAAGPVSLCPAGAGQSGCRHHPSPSRCVHAWPLETGALDPQPGPAAALSVPAHPWAACPCRWRNDCAGAVSQPCLLHKRAVTGCRHSHCAAETSKPCLRPIVGTKQSPGAGSLVVQPQLAVLASPSRQVQITVVEQVPQGCPAFHHPMGLQVALMHVLGFPLALPPLCTINMLARSDQLAAAEDMKRCTSAGSGEAAGTPAGPGRRLCISTMRG